MDVHNGAYEEGYADGQYAGRGEALHVNDLADGEEALNAISKEDLRKIDTENNDEGYAKEDKPVETGGIGRDSHCAQPGDEHTGIEGVDEETTEPYPEEVATGDGNLCGGWALGL